MACITFTFTHRMCDTPRLTSRVAKERDDGHLATFRPHPPQHGRIVQLDGLRAIAVGAVFLQHALKAPLWMGVDLFFVLSGLLITGILLDRKARGQSYFSHFYARRVRRILPPYVLLLVVSTILFGAGWLPHWPWFAFFSTNIGLSLGSIGHDSLNVLWSLAVEEQFYIFWPFVVLGARSARCWVAAALIVAAPCCARSRRRGSTRSGRSTT